MRRCNNYYKFGAALVVAFSAGAAAYALTSMACCKNQKKYFSCKCKEDKSHKFKHIYKILKEKIGVTDEDINKAIAYGESTFELVKNMGYSVEQFKDFIINEKTSKIEELIINRKVTRELGEKIKQKIRTQVLSWDGRI